MLPRLQSEARQIQPHPRTEAAVPPLASFERAWQLPLRRPLVDPPPPAAVTARAVKPGLGVRLIGTIVDGQRPRGVFMVGLANVELKSVGEKAGGAEIVAIDDNTATLTFQGETVILAVRRTRSIPPEVDTTQRYGLIPRRSRSRTWITDREAPFVHPLPWALSLAAPRANRASSEPIDIPITAADETADAVAAALKTAGYRFEPVLLAIPSHWCLCASVTTAGLPRKERRRAMIYRLEEKLPLAAEDVVADFLPAAPACDQNLGVCVQKQTVATLVDALEAKGVAIASICPAALLAFSKC